MLPETIDASVGCVLDSPTGSFILIVGSTETSGLPQGPRIPDRMTTYQISPSDKESSCPNQRAKALVRPTSLLLSATHQLRQGRKKQILPKIAQSFSASRHPHRKGTLYR